MRYPTKEIPYIIRNKNRVSKAINDFFDKVFEKSVYPRLIKLYDLTRYTTIPDHLLDFILYDKGFSTSKNLTPDMKRCILSKHDYITQYRLSPQGLETYLSCMLQNVNLVFVGARQKNFITPGSTVFGFGNQAMLNTVGTSVDFMTYIYHPSYHVNVYLYIEYDFTSTVNRGLMSYINSLVSVELPQTGIITIWNTFFLRRFGTAVVSGTSVTVTGGNFLSLYAALPGWVLINGEPYKVIAVVNNNTLTIETPYPTPGTYPISIKEPLI